MKIDERHLVQLAAVVQAGGVTEGAALLGLSQPAVSRTLVDAGEARSASRFSSRGAGRCSRRRSAGRWPIMARRCWRHRARPPISSQLSPGPKRRGAGRRHAFLHGCADRRHDRRFPEPAYPDVRVDQSYGYFPTCAPPSMPTASTLPSARSTFSTRAPAWSSSEILPGRNVVACRVTHPLLMRRRSAGDLLDYPWIAPPPGSPLLADLRSMLLSLRRNRNQNPLFRRLADERRQLHEGDRCADHHAAQRRLRVAQRKVDHCPARPHPASRSARSGC